MRILSMAPTRISLFGGSTDLPEFASRYGGFCLNMAINIRQEILLTNDNQIIKYPTNGSENFYWLILNEFGIGKSQTTGFNASFNGEITGGIGSSAAAAVALIGAVNKYKNLGMSRADIAEKAWNIETNKLNLYGGRQDQYCAAFGGVNGMEFRQDQVTVVPLSRNFADKLYPSLVLFHLGFNRKNPRIQEGFKGLTQGQIFYLDKIKKLVTDAIPYIGEGDIEAVGRLLDKSWELKKKSNKGVGSPVFEMIYRKAKKLGAWGGKICGAGGGGYCIFMIDPAKRQNLIDSLGIKWIDYDWDFNGVDVRRID